MTMRITETIARSGTLKKTKTRKGTRLVTSEAAAIEIVPRRKISLRSRHFPLTKAVRICVGEVPFVGGVLIHSERGWNDCDFD